MTRPRDRRILVLGNDARSTLAIVRSLGRAGHTVDLGWCLPGDAPAASRYVSRRRDIPLPTVAHDWLDHLRAALVDGAYDLVIPSSDLELIPLVLGRSALESVARLAVPSDEAFAWTFDKRRSIALAEELGLPVPRWREVPPGTRRLPPDIAVPCVLKPMSSFDLRRPTETKHHVRAAFSRPLADALVAEMLADGPVIAQEYFPGRGVGVEVLARDGRVLAAFQHERLHEPPEGGGSTYRRSTAPDAPLLAATRRLVEAMRYSGVLMVEFKRDARGAWMFVEVNARFWGSLPLTVAAGCDMPAWLVEMMLDGRERFPADYRVGVRCRHVVKDLGWFVHNWRGDHQNRNLIWTPRLRSVADLVALLVGRDHVDLYARDDPHPWYASLRQLGARSWQELRARLPMRRASLDPERSLLFLCRGNICRSAFAEHRLRQLRPRQSVASAGTYPRAGRPSPGEAVRAAGRHGVDLAGHRSRMADDRLLATADEIVVFHPAELTWLRAHHPAHARKAVYLGGAIIADPFAAGPGAFAGCYARIERELVAAVDRATG